MLRRLLAPIVGTLDPMTPLILATTVGEIEFVERAVLREGEAPAEPNSRKERCSAGASPSPMVVLI